MENKLDIIIRLLTEINDKLTPTDQGVTKASKPKKPTKLSKKALFHREAVEGLERQKILDEKRANRKFAPELAELDKLEKELEDLRQKNDNLGKK